MPIELTGMDELLARLQRTTQDVGAVKKKALMAGAEIIRDEIEARAPVDTGLLKKWIVVSEIKQDTDGTEYVNVGPEESIYWAKFNEFGTESQKAVPFVEPAFISKRKEALAVMAGIVKEAIDNV